MPLVELRRGLVGYWKMDEALWDGTLDEVLDHSGQGNHGTASNGASTVSGGKLGRAGDFDNAQNHFVECGSSPSLLPDAFSVLAWVRFTGSGTFPLIGFSTGTLDPSVNLDWSDDRAFLYLGATNFRRFNRAIAINDGTWHHVAFTVPGSGQNDILGSKFYIDGQEQSVYTAMVSGPQRAKSSLRIARASWADLLGQLDNLAFYDRAVTGAEVSAHYNSGAGVLIRHAFKVAGPMRPAIIGRN